MAENHILIADANAGAWVELRDALGEGWAVVGAATGGAALEEAQKQTFDVVVANYELPDLTGTELLNRLHASCPRILLFIAAGEALKEKVMCDVLQGHQFLRVPFDRATLKSSIERSVTADYGMNDSLRELVGRIRTFPTIPSLYVEVVNALKNPNATTEEIGAIIAKDMAMTTKLLQVLNSAYFGLPRTITDPTEAIGLLGYESVKSLIVTVKFLSQYDKVKPVYFSIDKIWRHSTNVARTARVMALLETGDNDCSAVAYTAGLMHDLGKVILAANFGAEYHGTHNVARKQQIPLWAVEKEIFGATHGEIGAYLLGLWGMSPEVVKVAALHHHPRRAGDITFTALTAVHVADAFEYEGSSELDGLPVPALDTGYLQQLDLEERVARWRNARRDFEGAAFDTKAQRAKSTAKPAAKPEDAAPAPASQANKCAPAQSWPGLPMLQGAWKWLGLGLGATAALVLLAWLGAVRLESMAERPEVQKIAENPPAPVQHEMAAIVASARPTEEAKPAPVPPTHAAAVEPVQPSPVPTSAPAPSPPPVITVLEHLKLQGIFYNSRHPLALISGELAGVNQEVAECRVLDINPSCVIVEYLHQRRTLILR